MKHYLTIDVGGTAIKYGVLDEQQQFAQTGEWPTQAEQGGPAVLGKILRIVEQTKSSCQLQGVCVSTAGVVDVEKGEVVFAAGLMPGYTGTKIKEAVEARFALPCEVENDVNCAGLSEFYAGAAQGADSSLCLTVGTGIGGSLILDGRVYHGHAFGACEIGHMKMLGSDFQSLAAASVLVAKVAQRKNAAKETLNGKLIFDMAKAGDQDCIGEIDRMVDMLGYGIANLCCCFNPEIVVMGGGIMAEKDYLGPRLRVSLDRHAMEYIARHTKLAFAVNKNKAGMLGAYYHFIARQEGGAPNGRV